jgi:hypothetical protein
MHSESRGVQSASSAESNGSSLLAALPALDEWVEGAKASSLCVASSTDDNTVASRVHIASSRGGSDEQPFRSQIMSPPTTVAGTPDFLGGHMCWTALSQTGMNLQAAPVQLGSSPGNSLSLEAAVSGVEEAITMSEGITCLQDPRLFSQEMSRSCSKVAMGESARSC